MTRIGLVIPTFSPASMTGPIRHTTALAAGLFGHGYDVSIITSKPAGSADASSQETAEGVEIIRLPVTARIGHWIWCHKLSAVLRAGKFDVIHAQLYRNYFTEVAAKVAASGKTPFVLSPRGSLRGYTYLAENRVFQIPNRAYDLATQKRALRDAEVVVTCEQELQDAIHLGIGLERLHLIPHGVDFRSLHSPHQGRDGDGTSLLFVGRITEQRNVEFLLRGFAIASAKNPTLRLSVVGDAIPSRFNMHERGYIERVHRLVENLGLEEAVTFTGGLYGADLWRAYLTHEIFVYTSRYDNFGHALVEAAYFGLPIISTPVGIAEDLVDQDGGVIVAGDDDQELAGAILMASSSKEWRERARERLQARCRDYAIERNVDAHTALYESLLGREHGSKSRLPVGPPVPRR